MRYDKPIYFQRVIPGGYNPETGNHDPDTIVETKRYASVTNTDTETLNLVYGEIRQGSFVIRMQNHPGGLFDRIRIGSRQYRVDHSQNLRTKQVFVVSEVQG